MRQNETYLRSKPIEIKKKTEILTEEHKEFIINLYDQNPQTRVVNVVNIVDVVESLTKAFENFSLKETSVCKFMKNECGLSFKRVTLHPEEDKL